MSGIIGFIQFDAFIDKEDMVALINKMHKSLYDKKPNETTIFSTDNCAISRTQNFAENEKYLIVFHGDLYNIIKLAEEIGAEENEAEIVLKGYQSLGEQIFKALDGKFAIVIYDKTTNGIKFVRDKVGSKQIYYYKSDKFLVFSSELTVLLSSGLVPKKINKVALSRYLQLTYIPAPISIIENVFKVKPAIVLSVEKGVSSEKVYWQIVSGTTNVKYKDFDYCKPELYNLMFDSVQEKLSLYKNAGAFLSGGFDSSIVVSIMSNVSSTPVNTFTIGFNNKEFDESKLAQFVADKNNTNHRVFNLDLDTVVEQIPTILNGLDEPFADSSLIATYAVCNFAKKYVDVAFMGDGGDELFAGYNRYLIGYYSERYKKIPSVIRKSIIEPLFKLIPAHSYLALKINKVINSTNIDGFEQRKRLLSLGFKPDELSELMIDGFVDSMDFVKQDYYALENSDEQTRTQYVDFKTVLEGCMLPKVELASKISGLKTCAPILDSRIIEFAYKIPTEFKINKKNLKIILKETFKDLLPDELYSAPKHGFGVPIAEWFEKDLKDNLLKYADKEFLEKQGLFNFDYINMIIEEHMSRKNNRFSELWSFYVFQNWYSRNFK